MQSSSPSLPEAGPGVADGNGYRAWAAACIEQWGWPVEGTVFLAEPDREVPARVEAARAQGVIRIVCGFLPDEVDWAVDARPGTVQYFLDVSRFVPWLMAGLLGAGSPCEAPQHILLVKEDPAETARDTGAERLAGALSMWRGLPVRAVAAEALAGVAVSAELLASWAVVHETRDWNLGFKIDHAAATAGVRCFRLGGPEYSPLRYSLFGGWVRRSGSADVHGLRDLLSAPAPVSPVLGDWFGSAESTDRWRSLWRDGAEPGFRVQAAGGGADTGGASRWSARRESWMGLLGAARHTAFPREAVREALREAARRLWVDDRAGCLSRSTELAVTHLLRQSPDWIREFRSVVGRSPRADALVRRWSLTAIELGRSEGGALTVLREGQEVWSSPDPECVVAAALLKIARGEMEGLQPLAGRSLNPPWRAVAVDAAIAFLGSLGVERTRGALLLDGMNHALGAAAPLLRFAHGLLSRDFGSCRKEWRERYRMQGLSTGGGGAVLVRAALPDAEAWARWLRERAIGTDDQVWGEITHLVSLWYQRRVWALWSFSPQDSVRSEHRVALRLLRQCVRARADRAVDWHRLAILEAFTPDASEAGAAIEQFARLAGSVGDLSAIVALALAWRGRGHDAHRFLEMKDTSGATPPIVSFIRALAWQSCGRADRAEVELESWAAWPDTLSAAQRDAALVWLAALFGRSAVEPLAGRLQAAALAVVPPSLVLLRHLPASTECLCAAWERLAVQSLARLETAS